MKHTQKHFICLIAGLLLTLGCSQYNKVADELSFLTPDKFQCTVLKVYSGDRFLCQLPGLDDETIQLLGIRIPDDKTAAAKKYTGSVLKRGTLVKIETENVKRNSYGNIQAYVFPPGGKMLNIVLAVKGLADVNIDEIVKYKPSFIEIDQQTEVEIIEENLD